MVMDKSKCDFSGYATKVNQKCSDGRTILKDAFKDNDGMVVPLVWAHLHNDPSNVLGHGLLENREDGVYIYAFCNETPNGINTKKMVQHGDIVALSIYANELVEQSKFVQHGVIREVSLVMAGANPGARIDNVALSHGDGTQDDLLDEVIIHTDQPLIPTEPVKPVEEVKPVEPVKPVEEVKPVEPVKPVEEVKPTESTVTTIAHAAGDKTVKEIIETLNQEQLDAVSFLMESLSEVNGTDINAISQSLKNGESQIMKTNVFEGENNLKAKATLTHDQLSTIIESAKQHGSLKNSFLEHAVTYGIENIDYLFPDAQALDKSPVMLARRMEWVTTVINGTTHSPFAKVKTIVADITADEARARGYVKGTLKKEEIIKLLKRETAPKTIYKKQKLDRDDVIDITDIDVIAWMKAEMRVMLDEELARAILVSDGRDALDPDKINEANIRPIWKDDDMYAHHIRLEEGEDADAVIDAIIRGRENYKGSGRPTLFTTSSFVSDMLLLKDTLGRRIYQTQAELEAVLRVAAIVEVPVMTGLSRESDDEVPVHLHLLGIVVNLRDYTIGANKGGEVSMFDDFDIDYNQLKYLIETRVSGALTLPKSALVIEQVGAAG